MLGQRNLHDTLLEQGILEQIRNWLYPWPSEDALGKEMPLSKRILPNLTLRSKLYQLMLTMPITPEHLKNSERGGVGRSDWPGLGKVILLLMKHPQETVEQKRVLKSLLEEWSRQLFKKPKDFKLLKDSIRDSTKVYKPQHSAGSGGGGSLQRSSSEVVDDLDYNGGGDGGVGGAAEADSSEFASRAARPFRIGFDFNVRPKSVEVKPATIGKNQQKINALSLKLKEAKRKAKTSSQRGVAPSFKVHD
jgi:hypothetical protein